MPVATLAWFPNRRLGFLATLSALAIAMVLIWSAFHRDHDGAGNVDRAGSQRSLPVEFLVDVNTDRWVEFANLPGIGPVTAKAIVEYRVAMGGFKTVDQLIDVKGIGPKTLSRVRRFLVVGEEGSVDERSTRAVLKGQPDICPK